MGLPPAGVGAGSSRREQYWDKWEWEGGWRAQQQLRLGRGRGWCSPHRHTLEALGEGTVVASTLQEALGPGDTHSDHPNSALTKGSVGTLPGTVEPSGGAGASPIEVCEAAGSPAPSYWPDSLFLCQDVQECGGWASLSTVLGMNPGSSAAQSRSAGRYVTFISWVSHVSALPGPSEPTQGGVCGSPCSRVRNVLFLSPSCKWVFNPVVPKTRYSDTAENNCKSREPRLNSQVGS